MWGQTTHLASQELPCLDLRIAALFLPSIALTVEGKLAYEANIRQMALSLFFFLVVNSMARGSKTTVPPRPNPVQLANDRRRCDAPLIACVSFSIFDRMVYSPPSLSNRATYSARRGRGAGERRRQEGSEQASTQNTIMVREQKPC